MPDLYIHPSTLGALRDAVYAAYEAGELSDEDYSDAITTLKGVPRDVKCKGRTFHRNPAHVCEPKS